MWGEGEERDAEGLLMGFKESGRVLMNLVMIVFRWLLFLEILVAGFINFKAGSFPPSELDPY